MSFSDAMFELFKGLIFLGFLWLILKSNREELDGIYDRLKNLESRFISIGYKEGLAKALEIVKDERMCLQESERFYTDTLKQEIKNFNKGQIDILKETENILEEIKGEAEHKMNEENK